MLRRMNRILYKLIGVCCILASLCVVHFAYFQQLKYGHEPFLILCLLVLGIYLILPYLLDKAVASIGLAFYAIYTVVQVCYCKLFDQYLYLQAALSLYEEVLHIHQMPWILCQQKRL